LIAGIGPIGLMAAFALRLRGADVIGMDIVDEDSLRPRILKQIGGTYVNGKNVQGTDLDEVYGEADFIFEAAGIAKLQIQLIDALAINGIYVVTGIPADERPLNIPVGIMMQQLVLKNQVIVGSVNASIHHYKMAVEDLGAGLLKWPAAMNAIITEKINFQDFEKAFHQHSDEEIKVVIEWKQ
ncbi:MAG: alcohol dehydrogenase, partial [Chitinophagaceae bacterium]